MSSATEMSVGFHKIGGSLVILVMVSVEMKGLETRGSCWKNECGAKKWYQDMKTSFLFVFVLSILTQMGQRNEWHCR